jgi:hypothetical protein
MISSEALHLGPLMLPWGLLILLVALLITDMIRRKVGQQPDGPRHAPAQPSVDRN